MPDTLVFTYFDFPALGEAVRLALAMTGKDWEDKRISFDDFKQLKPSKTTSSGLGMTLIIMSPQFSVASNMLKVRIN